MIYCDGFHNKKGTGFTITDEDGKVIFHALLNRETNNGSELWGIYKAVDLSISAGTVVTDSQVCIAWLKRGRAQARPDLDQLIRDINRLKAAKSVRVVWGPRDSNKAGLWNEERF